MLRRCLETLLESKGVDLRVVVVVNGGDDPLPQIVHSDERVDVVRLRNGVGFSRANNRGVAWARRERGRPDGYLFLNNDTEMTPGSLSRLVDVLAVTGSALLMRAQVFEDSREWSEPNGYYFEDIDLCLKAREAGYEVIVGPAAEALHRVSATLTLESDR